MSSLVAGTVVPCKGVAEIKVRNKITQLGLQDYSTRFLIVVLGGGGVTEHEATTVGKSRRPKEIKVRALGPTISSWIGPTKSKWRAQGKKRQHNCTVEKKMIKKKGQGTSTDTTK
jgi:hypothetical protein